MTDDSEFSSLDYEIMRDQRHLFMDGGHNWRCVRCGWGPDHDVHMPPKKPDTPERLKAIEHGQAIRQAEAAAFDKGHKAGWEKRREMEAGKVAAARKAALEEKVARYADDLAKIYIKHPLAVAQVCDKCLDRSGGLLGIVRDKAMAIRALAESDKP